MKSYQCSYSNCKRTYKNQFNLKRHISINHHKTRFKCKTCQKKLFSAQSLKHHVFCHTGEKSYICKFPGCAKRYRQGSQMSSHKKMHAGQQIEKVKIFAELKLTFLFRPESNEIYEVPKGPFLAIDAVLPQLRTDLSIKDKIFNII